MDIRTILNNQPDIRMMSFVGGAPIGGIEIRIAMWNAQLEAEREERERSPKRAT